jgi:hypothetical protein
MSVGAAFFRHGRACPGHLRLSCLVKPRRGCPRSRLVPGITNRYCSRSFETATSRPPQDEVSFVETQKPHAEERATRASRSMGSKRPTALVVCISLRRSGIFEPYWTDTNGTAGLRRHHCRRQPPVPHPNDEADGFYEVAAVHSMETPAASMMPSMTSRNISGSSRNTKRLAMKAPNIKDEPAIRPFSAMSGVSAPNR